MRPSTQGYFLSLNLDDRGLGSAVDTVKAKVLAKSPKENTYNLRISLLRTRVTPWRRAALCDTRSMSF